MAEYRGRHELKYYLNYADVLQLMSTKVLNELLAIDRVNNACLVSYNTKTLLYHVKE